MSGLYKLAARSENLAYLAIRFIISREVGSEPLEFIGVGKVDDQTTASARGLLDLDLGTKCNS